MSEPTRNSDLSGPDDPARTRLSDAPGPDETTDHAASAESAHDTPPRADTSVKPDSPNGDTAAHHPAADPFDPARTGLHTPSQEPGEEAEGGVASVPGYEILEEVARGGMGVVYKARQTALDRVVALKMILAGAYAAGETVARFEAEARAVARFQHPNIVQVFEVGRHDGLPYFSLEFVEGGTLAKKIAREPQPPAFAAETVEKLARAVQYAHDRGIVHRDLKPANVLLADDGTPKIADFGLAKSLEGDSGQTQSGQVLGTPSYMAPEQARGDVEAVGPAADVWALGAILYDLLTGRPPFAGSSVLDTLEMVRWRDPVPPSQLTAKLPRDLETICLKCLQKERARRYASAGELADDLRRFLEGRPIVARPVSRVERAWRWAKRNPVGALAALLGAALLIVPSILAVLLFVSEGKATESAKQENAAKAFAQGKQKEAEDALAGEKRAREAEQKELKRSTDNEKLFADQRNQSLFTVREVLRDVDGLMKHRADLAPLRLQIVNRMLPRLDTIRVPELQNVIDARTEAIAYSRIGSIYYDTNRVEKAEEWARRAYILLKKLADENPNDAAALFNLSNISNQLADVEWRLGNGSRARELYADALKIRRERVPIVEKLVADGATKPGGTRFAARDLIDAKYQVADSFGLVALTDLRLGDPDAAAEHYLASDKAFRELFPGGVVPKNQRVVRQRRAEIQLRLGDARLHQKRPDDAENHYRAAVKERESILADTPEKEGQGPTLRADLAHARMYLGDFLLMARDDRAAAVAEYDAALKLLTGVLKLVPDHLGLQQHVAAVHYRLGFAATRRSGFAKLFAVEEAGRHFGECLKLREALTKIDPADVHAKAELMLALGRVGRVAEADKLALELLGRKVLDRQTRFQAICGLAVASGGADDPEARKRRDRAFAELAELVRGWKALGQLQMDPDLEALRADPRFAKVVAGLSPRPQK
jgi:serine/threonine-protein kinase